MLAQELSSCPPERLLGRVSGARWPSVLSPALRAVPGERAEAPLEQGRGRQRTPALPG